MSAPTISAESVLQHRAMPHPERAREPLLGSDDGKWIFESIFAALEKKTAAKAA